MIAHSPPASITSVILRISSIVGATLLLLLIVLAIVRPDMMDLGAMMRRLTTAW